MELHQLPWQYVLGQGVLVKDSNEMTAFISIVQAAVAHLGDLVGLFEVLVSAIDRLIRSNASSIGRLFRIHRPQQEFNEECMALVHCQVNWLLGVKPEWDNTHI